MLEMVEALIKQSCPDFLMFKFHDRPLRPPPDVHLRCDAHFKVQVNPPLWLRVTNPIE